ncbi:MAG: alpha/beta hydrolase [Pseudomonadota bacterium]
MKRRTITGWGGAQLAVFEAGPKGAPKDAPTLMLIHGWSQHHLSWTRQVKSHLAMEFRLIVPDLRGHGASAKPDEPEAYNHSRPWADDVSMIIEEMELENPLLVGWSMGGRVIGDYLSHHGDTDIAGVVMIGASATSGTQMPDGAAELRKPDATATGTYSPDQATEISSVIAFVRACANKTLSKQDMAFHVGLNMLCPPHIRKAARLRDSDHREVYARLTKPAMVIHGDAERLCVKPLFEEMVAALPDPRVHIYAGDGHMPFWESPDRFNQDLAAFARATFGATA